MALISLALKYNQLKLIKCPRERKGDNPRSTFRAMVLNFLKKTAIKNKNNHPPPTTFSLPIMCQAPH